MDSSLADMAVAYRLVLNRLPVASVWAGAIAGRRDGSSVAGIAAELAQIRCRLLTRLGAGLDGCPPSMLPGAHALRPSLTDRIIAFELAIGQMPHAETWRAALKQREDGATVEGVTLVLRDIRSFMHACLGEMLVRAETQLDPTET
jgi:hypothetical protein